MTQQNNGSRRFNAVSIFTGAGGLDIGMERAGFNILMAADNNRAVIKTLKLNNPQRTVWELDIKELSKSLVHAFAGSSDIDLLIGGPPCQSFSTIGNGLGFNDPRGALAFEYTRLLSELKPCMFVFENVRSLMDYTRFADTVRAARYNVTTWKLNAADYGVPQNRVRVFTIGWRFLSGIETIAPPIPTHADNHLPIGPFISKLKGQRSLGPQDGMQYTPNKLRWMRKIPPGGNWKNLPKSQHASALGALYNPNTGQHTGVWRRLSMDKPSPTITTDPSMNLTMLGHPRYHRPLSVAECAAIQCFPKDWKFAGLRKAKYRMIGNAVPPPLAEAVGRVIYDTLKGIITT